MILQDNFMKMQQDETKYFVDKTAHRYSSDDDRVIAYNAYFQGRVDMAGDAELLAEKYRVLLKEVDKLKKELAKHTNDVATPPPVEGLGL